MQFEEEIQCGSLKHQERLKHVSIDVVYCCIISLSMYTFIGTEIGNIMVNIYYRGTENSEHRLNKVLPPVFVSDK